MTELWAFLNHQFFTGSLILVFFFQKPTTSSCLILNILKPEPEVINKIKYPPNTTFRHFIVEGNPALLWCSIVQRLVEICPIRISFDPCLQCSLESKVSIETCTPVSVWTLWRLLLFTFCQSLKPTTVYLGLLWDLHVQRKTLPFMKMGSRIGWWSLEGRKLS